MVLLGTPNPESSRLVAATVTEGDPTWAGPLAGVSLKLPVFHVTEAAIRAQLPAAVYEEQIGLADAVLDTGAIRDALAEVRAAAGATREETA